MVRTILENRNISSKDLSQSLKCYDFHRFPRQIESVFVRVYVQSIITCTPYLHELQSMRYKLHKLN